MPGDAGPLAVLQRVRRRAPSPRPGERCDLCAVPIGDEHAHIVELDSRSLKCACRACGVLFTNDGAGAGRFRRVPQQVYALAEAAVTEAVWEILQIPVGVAFLFTNSMTGNMSVFYPSPVGATESLLPLDAIEELVRQYPPLAEIAPDVEALLVRFDRSGRQCFVVPIDTCYELVGVLRQSWRGFDGGREAHDALEELFGRLRARARPMWVSGQRG